jgi:hypothetical protein
MPLLDIYRAVRDQTRDQRHSLQANNKSLIWRLSECFARTWDLGFSTYHTWYSNCRHANVFKPHSAAHPCIFKSYTDGLSTVLAARTSG